MTVGCLPRAAQGTGLLQTLESHCQIPVSVSSCDVSMPVNYQVPLTGSLVLFGVIIH